MCDTEFCIKTGLFLKKDPFLNCYRIFGVEEFNNSNLVIPSTFNGLEVRAIDEYAFENCQFLKSVIIPETITEIAVGAFAECYNLESITMPAITDELFKVEKAHLGCLFNDGYEYINRNSVYVPASLRSITFINGDSINDCCFYECNYIETINLPTTITKIGEAAFFKCKSLINFNIPNNVKIIEKDAFLNCEKLEEITIPDSVTKLGSSVFENCISLSKVVLGKGLKTLSYNLFEYCKSLEEIVIPDNVEIICKEAFSSCLNLNNVSLPEGIIIEEDAFEYCSSLVKKVRKK